ncbi:MAG TPA: sigma-70 family RNA polymerase sigma factor [Vicinamibacterales bacterium]|nr:sigma-70 family RNA polymerase sigma factor [Vicinamibacterales bacterium]
MTAAQDDRYAEAAAAYGPSLERLAQAYEPDADRRRDLLQEIHVALWKSLLAFDGRCSLRTWVYRVAHNVSISEVTRRRARMPVLVGLDAVEATSDGVDREAVFDRARARERLLALIHRLEPLDRQVIVLYLEGLEAAAIADVTGFSAANVATKVHRIKKLLAQRFREGTV